MLPYVAIPLTCWLCAAIATPRRPRLGDEVEELIYARLLGGQQRLALLALVATLAAFLACVAALPAKARPGAADTPVALTVCIDAPAGHTVCSVPLPGGMWRVDELQADGTWRTTGLTAHPPRPSADG